jgi:DNA-binding transcriptional ArsR family regulator
MVDVYFIENTAQVQAIAEPNRWRILDMLVVRSMTGSQLARSLHIPRTRAHYHLKILEKVGLVELQHEGLKGGIVEKYYGAVARQFRTDHLLDPRRLVSGDPADGDGPEAGRDAQATGRVVRDLMLAMLELTRADILQPDALAGLTKAGFNFQDELRLTAEQINALILDLRALGRRYLELDRQNSLNSDNGPHLHLRYTTLLTPVAALEFDSKGKDEV